MPETIFTQRLFDQFLLCHTAQQARALVSALPKRNRRALHKLVELFYLCVHTRAMKMTLLNLSICFGPNLLKKTQQLLLMNTLPLLKVLVNEKDLVFYVCNIYVWCIYMCVCVCVCVYACFIWEWWWWYDLMYVCFVYDVCGVLVYMRMRLYVLNVRMCVCVYAYMLYDRLHPLLKAARSSLLHGRDHTPKTCQALPDRWHNKQTTNDKCIVLYIFAVLINTHNYVWFVCFCVLLFNRRIKLQCQMKNRPLRN